ncbi:MAG: hypothetical protein ACOC0Z_05110 [Halohasta sp.]
MNRSLLVGGLLVAVLVVGGVGAAVYGGVGPVPGSEPTSDSDSETVFNETDNDGTTTEESPFTFTVDEIDDCGETCRDVTATVENTQDEPAESVTASTRIFAGENSTEDLLWEDTEEIGALAAGESHTTTERVELSWSEAYAVEQNGGWITIVTTIESDEETITVRENRQVA